MGSSESFTVNGQIGIVAPDSGILHASSVSSGTAILSRFYYNSGATEVGRITTDGSTTTFLTSVSDERLKKNFESWDENVLPHFKTLNPQRFHFLDEEDDSEKQKGWLFKSYYKTKFWWIEKTQ